MSSAGAFRVRANPSLTWTTQSPQVTKHGDSANQERDPVSTLDRQCGILADNPPSLFLDRAALQFNSGRTTDFAPHTEITLQDIPKHRLTPSLLVENEERELQRKDNQTWALVPPLYITFLSITCNP